MSTVTKNWPEWVDAGTATEGLIKSLSSGEHQSSFSYQPSQLLSANAISDPKFASAYLGTSHVRKYEFPEKDISSRLFSRIPLFTSKNEIEQADEKPDLIAHLRAGGFDRESDKLAALLSYDDSRDEDDRPMSLSSLRSLVLFLTHNSDLKTKYLVKRSDGLLQLEWPVGGGKYLTLKFFDNNAVRYVAVSLDKKRQGKKKLVSGVCHYEDVFSDLKPIGDDDWIERVDKTEIESSDDQAMYQTHGDNYQKHLEPIYKDIGGWAQLRDMDFSSGFSSPTHGEDADERRPAAA